MGDQPGQPVADEPADPAAVGDVRSVEGSEEPDVGQDHAEHGQPPPAAVAAGALHVQAGQDQDRRQEPATRAEPRRDRIPPQVSQLAVAGQQQGNQGHDPDHEEGDPDQRADDLRVDVQAGIHRHPAGRESSGPELAAAPPAAVPSSQTSTTTGKTIGRRFVCSYR